MSTIRFINYFSLLICLFAYKAVSSQIINAYASITSVSGTTLLVANVNETSHTFTVGGKVVLMQMQDDVIGANTGDVSTFGDLSGISSAGLYEIGTIASRSPATGTPTSITLSSAPANTYHTGANSSLQLISFRDMGSNFTTTSAITGLAWNGTVGGVIAFEVTNTLTLNHPISADVIGFRKGLINTNPIAGSCLPSIFRTSANSEAFKGEGIYKSTDVNYTNARGKILNGGGGGNQHNAGGGGGGNYSSGGIGGFGYSCGSGANASGGFGGISLSGQIASNRIFMGGGGGGGQQNNTVGLDGGSGGGIIFIKANTMATNTVCGSAIKITANGGSTASAGNDGAGGGGAAGSIVLQVNNFSSSAACPLSINANGGNGGNVSDGAEHGGGGGGGQGAVVFSTTQPTVNISTTTTNGTGGANNGGGASYAGNGGGVNNTGILSMGGPLPVELLSFQGEADFAGVRLYWVTASERNNDHYIVERSSDGINYGAIGKLSAEGTTYRTSYYELYDYEPLKGINYYRLRQTDKDTRYRYSNTISLTFNTEFTLSLYPNPAHTQEPLFISLGRDVSASVEVSMYDATGKQLSYQSLVPEKNILKIADTDLPKGIYLVRILSGNTSQTRKLVIE